LGGPPRTSARREREQGFRLAAEGSAITLLATDGLDSEATPDGGAAATRRLLDRGEIPDAIIAYSDIVAVGIYAELARRGLEPGRDIAVVGFDDIPGSAHRTPPLTTVATFPTKIGEKCGEVILRRILAGAPTHGVPTNGAPPDGGTPAFVHDLVEPALRVRASTAAWRPRRS
jgi:LacI family transcriptional regulator